MTPAAAGTPCSPSSHGILILLTHLLIFLSSNTITQSTNNVSEIDRQALLSFKHNIVEDPTGVLRSWSSLNFCNWRGVTCGITLPPRVVSLNLSSENLQGQVSPWIANLTSLEQVDLSDNSFVGVIPEELGRLQHLKFMILSGNNLEGIIPRSLGTSRSLIHVNLTTNRLVGPIPEFHKMSALQTLILSRNNLVGSIPKSLGSSRYLKHVDLSVNSLAGHIPDFHKMSALQYLDLSYNELSGSVPSSLGNASSLRVIWLAVNTLSGSIPETLSLIQNLSELSLADNDLSGHVSAELCNISSLLFLGLAQNNLIGRIPSSIGNTLPNLERLSMSFNRFGGLIPSSLANASKLQQIDLGYNSLVGPVPSLGSLADLQLLNLQSNFLEAEGWEFIISLANCAQLQILDMSGNALIGSFPRSVGNLSTSLRRLNLGSNQIIGTIPVELFNLLNLRLLAMDQNLLTGVIPPVIGNLDQLFILNLSGNKFSGQIPPTIGNLSWLNKLYLDSNGLSGIIPASLGYCKQLDMLNLSFNSLQGQIPNGLVNSTALLDLDLSNNKLTGSIPLQIGALLQLLRLNISFNNLSGQVPLSLGRCVQLSSLILRSNMLNGSIPLSFTDLKSIGEIDLSENYLGGQIPEFLANMGYLQKLDLSINFFEGPIPTGGIFQNYSAVILDGNTGLCETAAAIFGLPICPTKSTTKRKMNARLLLIITPPVTIAFLSFLCVVVTIMKGTKAQPSENFKETMKRVSYGNIIKATNWFSLVNRISSSHTASVYIGRFEFETDIVAIKVFHLNEQGSKKSFFTECEVLKHTRHRNLVQAITLCSTVDFDDNEFKAIVYEFMANGSLDMWIHPRLHRGSPRRFLSLGQRISIAADVASALDYLHNQLTPPMIHCDLKPSHVLLDYEMTSRIGDFGSAKFLSSSLGTPEGLTGVGGTIGYIAPEYGMGCKISTGGDVYSFGVLLLEMLTAVRPTDAQCGNAFSLHKYVDLAFPDRIAEVLDPHMPCEEDELATSLRMPLHMQNYILPLFSIGLMCSMESPKDRPGMHDVCAKIVAIKEAFVETL